MIRNTTGKSKVTITERKSTALSKMTVCSTNELTLNTRPTTQTVLTT